MYGVYVNMLYIYVYANMCVYIYLLLLHSDLLNYCIGEDEVSP